MEVPQWTAQLALESQPNAAGDFYLSHPDGRVVAAFFLGSVFMHGLHYSVSSTFVRYILRKVRGVIRIFLKPLRPKTVMVDAENPLTLSASEKGGYGGRKTRVAGMDIETQSMQQRNDHSALVFVLNLCLMFAAFAQFLTLLTFGSGWETGCTFVVAWGGMSSQMARLLGMLILILELTVLLDFRRYTVWTLRGMLVVALVFVFASNATNTGTTSTPQGARTSFCYRQHFLPTSLVSSIIHLVMELYLAARVIRLLLSSRRLFDDISSSCPLARILGLFILDLLTVVPDAISTNIFAQFIPFAVGSILVLATFNWRLLQSRSPVQSVIMFNRPPVTADPLLVPTPFTLHFPPEFRDRHSWCSESDHPPPASTEDAEGGPAQSTTSIRTDNSTDVVSTRNVENAIITRASQAWRRSVRQVSFDQADVQVPFPRSAPAQLVGFNNPPQTGPRKILPSQVLVAAALDREWEQEERKQAQSIGLAVPPSHARSRSGVMAHETEDDISIYSQEDAPVRSPGSAFFGSDILRRASGRRLDRGGIDQPSPAPTQTSFMLSPYDSRRSTYRYSYNSGRTMGRSSDDSASDEAVRLSSSRASKSRSFLSPTDSFMKSPLRALSRYSFTSMRARSRDELPTVREASPGPDPNASEVTAAGQIAQRRSRRTTFGHSSLSQKRANNRPSLQSVFQSPPGPVPPVPALLLPTPRTVSPFAPTLSDDRESLPTVHVSPATPDPTSLIAPPPSAGVVHSPAWLSRPIRSSGVRGPRPLPTASIIQGSASGWPRALLGDTASDAADDGHHSSVSRTRSRSNSLPASLHSSKSLSGTAKDVRKPSA